MIPKLRKATDTRVDRFVTKGGYYGSSLPWRVT
jgi:hypothetical protein